MKSIDVKIIFLNIYRLCRNWVMNSSTQYTHLVVIWVFVKLWILQKCSGVFYIIIANYCIKSCVANPKELLTSLLRDSMLITWRFRKSCRAALFENEEKTGSKKVRRRSRTCCRAGQPKFVVRSSTAFPSTFVPSTFFLQVRLKQYEGLHIDTLVVPVVCIRIKIRNEIL